MSDEIELSEKEYGELKRALAEWSDLVESYELGFVGDVEQFRESLDNRVEVTYTVPVYDDVQAALLLLEKRHDTEIADIEVNGDWLVECNCGSLVVPGFDETECNDCGMRHSTE